MVCSAVGTVATTGAVGLFNAAAGAGKMAEASDMEDRAQSAYNKERTNFEKVQESTNNELKVLGEEKLKIWESFERFASMYSKIKNPPVMNGKVTRESLSISEDELKNIRAVAISAKDLLSGGIASVATGNLIGLAASGGIMSTITVASTGTAISSLSGAAATNATLAALGGGTLASHGAGVAGGLMLKGGLTFAPMLMVGGIMLNSSGKKALESAKDIKGEADKAVKTMQDAEKELERVRSLSQAILTELRTLNRKVKNLSH